MNSVDVVIPCYNYARYLLQCTASVLEQEGVDVRVLIIDDCSQDETEMVGRQLASHDRRVEFLRHARNRGHIATYNEGLLEWASSDYSLLLSADDALAPGALCRATSVMERHKEVGMTYGEGQIILGDDSYPAPADVCSSEYTIISGADFLRHFFLIGNCVHTPTAVVRTELQQRLGGYRADLPHSGDMEMWMRFAAHASVGAHCAVQGYYRKHSENMSHRYFSQILGDQREVVMACDQVLEQWGARFPDAGYWREMMCQRISKEACWLASKALDSGNTEGYEICLGFAEHVYPKIRDSFMWWKLRAKRAIGQTLWKKILPAWKRFRTIRAAASVQLKLNS